jgi:hypothetical protein
MYLSKLYTLWVNKSERQPPSFQLKEYESLPLDEAVYLEETTRPSRAPLYHFCGLLLLSFFMMGIDAYIQDQWLTNPKEIRREQKSQYCVLQFPVSYLEKKRGKTQIVANRFLAPNKEGY